MTDNEIMKALECCKRMPAEQCGECPIQTNEHCTSVLASEALNLINQYEAEIERLEYNSKIRRKNLRTLKAEAIKEFAERLRYKICCIPQCHFTYPEVDFHIDNLVEEMVGEENGCEEKVGGVDPQC